MWHTHLRKLLYAKVNFQKEKFFFLSVVCQSETWDVIDWSFMVIILCMITESGIIA